MNLIEFEQSSHASLLEFFCKYGINTTTNFDLMDIADDLELPLKVLMKDELKEKHIEKEIPLIINYQNSNQKGIHWVGYYLGNYFDSYGLPPLKQLEKHVVEYNKIDFQSNTDLTYCGQLTLYVLWKLYMNVKFNNIARSGVKSLLEELNYFLKK